MSNETNKPNNRVRIGGLWPNKNDYGTFYTGKLSKQDLEAAEVDAQGNIKIVIFKAKEQKSAQSPTHNVFAFSTGGTPTPKKPTTSKTAAPVEPDVDEDELI